MFVVGITGGIGSGKTTVANFFRRAGLTVIDADELSRECTEPKGRAIEPIRENFGPEYITKEGGLNRAKMARLVFTERNRLDELTLILHAMVVEETQARIKALEKKKAQAVVLDVPIPIKEGFLDICDYIIVVQAEPERRRERLIERGMTPADIERRMAVQMPPEEYARLGDIVVDNDGGPEELAEKIAEIMNEQLAARGIIYQPIN
ncbi:MAG: dephospho-CoA kinase [Clostridiaceae bacterium]|nr:dephospho-CoA kinase [Clostridiaceae bacterium]